MIISKRQFTAPISNTILQRSLVLTQAPTPVILTRKSGESLSSMAMAGDSWELRGSYPSLATIDRHSHSLTWLIVANAYESVFLVSFIDPR